MLAASRADADNATPNADDYYNNRSKMLKNEEEKARNANKPVNGSNSNGSNSNGSNSNNNNGNNGKSTSRPGICPFLNFLLWKNM